MSVKLERLSVDSTVKAFKRSWRSSRKQKGLNSDHLNLERAEVSQILEENEQERQRIQYVFDKWGSVVLHLLVSEGQLSDANETRGVPSIEESFYTTELLLKKEGEIIELLRDNVVGVIRVGSLAWSKYYWLYAPHEKQRSSDLDLEVICREEDIEKLLEHPFFSTLPDFPDTINNFLIQYKAGLTDFVTFRMEFDGIPVSMHFVPIETFDKICSADYENAMEAQIIREFRMKPRSAGYVYKQRDFRGDIFQFQAEVVHLEKGVNIHVPLILFNERGEFVMGYPPDKYLSGVIRLDDDGVISDNFEKMKRSVRSRLLKERQVNPGGKLLLSSSFCRSHRINPLLKAKIDREFEATSNT